MRHRLTLWVSSCAAIGSTPSATRPCHEIADTSEVAVHAVPAEGPLSRRVEQFTAALAEAGCAPARVVAWSDWLAGRVRLEGVVREGDVVRS